MSRTTAPASPTRVVDASFTLALDNGRILTGSLEHLVDPRSLVIFDEGGLDPTVLTVRAGDAPSEHAALADDMVILRNWTELRGVPHELAGRGFVELTGEEVAVGMFRLQALVAKVL